MLHLQHSGTRRLRLFELRFLQVLLVDSWLVDSRVVYAWLAGLLTETMPELSLSSSGLRLSCSQRILAISSSKGTSHGEFPGFLLCAAALLFSPMTVLLYNSLYICDVLTLWGVQSWIGQGDLSLIRLRVRSPWIDVVLVITTRIDWTLEVQSHSVPAGLTYIDEI